MKIVVCVSGAFKADGENIDGGRRETDTVRNFKINRTNLINAFSGADFYFSTWDTHEDAYRKVFGLEGLHIFPEPKIEYHPFIDVKNPLVNTPKFMKTVKHAKSDRVFWERSSKQTRQILAHAFSFETLSSDYDIVVRARHDTFVYKYANFTDLIYEAAKESKAIGFATTKDYLKTFYTIHKMTGTEYSDQFLFDQLIIHPKKIFDPHKVYELHHDRELLPAEFGWYQVLSYPKNNHECYCGWVNPDKHVPKEYIK